MKILKLLEYAIAIIIALTVWFCFTEIVHGTVERSARNDGPAYDSAHEAGNNTATGTPGMVDEGRLLDDDTGGKAGFGGDCVEITKGNWDCTDIETLRKLKNYVSWKRLGETVKATITWYSRKDSCHNPVIKAGKKLCLTAIGRDTVEGRTVACPRNIKLGTRIRIQGQEYICEDRTAEWVQRRNGPTFDIFHEQNPGWGKMAVQVEIL